MKNPFLIRELGTGRERFFYSHNASVALLLFLENVYPSVDFSKDTVVSERIRSQSRFEVLAVDPAGTSVPLYSFFNLVRK